MDQGEFNEKISQYLCKASNYREDVPEGKTEWATTQRKLKLVDYMSTVDSILSLSAEAKELGLDFPKELTYFHLEFILSDHIDVSKESKKRIKEALSLVTEREKWRKFNERIVEGCLYYYHHQKRGRVPIPVKEKLKRHDVMGKTPLSELSPEMFGYGVMETKGKLELSDIKKYYQNYQHKESGTINKLFRKFELESDFDVLEELEESWNVDTSVSTN